MNMLYWNFVLSYTNTVGIDCLQLYKGNYKLPELNISEFYPPLFNLLRCPISNIVMYKDKKKKHCMKIVQIQSYFWSVSSCIQSEYGDLRSK